jgi:hypothetical protein
MRKEYLRSNFFPNPGTLRKVPTAPGENSGHALNDDDAGTVKV